MKQKIDKILSKKTLYLSQQDLTQESAQYIATQDVSHIKYVIINFCSIKRNELLYLGQANWINLIDLNLNCCQITARECRIITKIHFCELIDLSLIQNHIGCEGISHLVKAGWKKMQSIKIFQNSLRSNVCHKLIKNDWKNLKKLYLSRGQMDESPYNDKMSTESAKCILISKWLLDHFFMIQDHPISGKSKITFKQLCKYRFPQINLLF